MPDWNRIYRRSPPWDIGCPQPAFEALARSGEIGPGAVLDVGCGTGDNAIMLARYGCAVTGLDVARNALERAKAKAAAHHASINFISGNALELDRYFAARAFDAVTDSGLFHVLTDDERPIYATQVGRVLKPGGGFFMLCFADAEPGEYPLPRRVSRREIEATFGKLFRIRYVRDVRFQTLIGSTRQHAYLLSATKN